MIRFMANSLFMQSNTAHTLFGNGNNAATDEPTDSKSEQHENSTTKQWQKYNPRCVVTNKYILIYLSTIFYE